jgi:formamidopyrimidine-DNA glycosylase
MLVARTRQYSDVPELPEVESARALIDEWAVEQRIVAVTSIDSYTCRPHRPEEIRDALTGRRLLAAHRKGKTMWCPTSRVARASPAGPVLGLHLGMGGRLIVTDRHDDTLADSTHELGGEHNAGWDRLVLTFRDGSALRLVDKRRLGRVVLDPQIAAIGVDALEISLAEFRQVVARGHGPIKARLLNQAAIAGIGNLLADELLWQAGVAPTSRVDDLNGGEVDRLYRAMGRTIRSSLSKGGAHTGTIIEHRRPGGHCPRCGAAMVHATVGGRSSWWCPAEQV